MKFYSSLILGACFLLLLSSCHGPEPTIKGRSNTRVLFIADQFNESKDLGKAMAAILDTMSPNGWQLESEYNYQKLIEDSIHKFSAILLADVFEDSLNVHKRTALQRYVEAGGGLLLADQDTMRPYEWSWYEQIRTTPPANVVLWETASAIDITSLVGNNQFDLAECTTPPAPRDEQFNIEILDNNIYEPMEMEILPQGEILFLERRGLMKIHDPFIDQTRVVHDFNVCIEGNYEDGLHGIALDPAYGKDNHWLYLYYSPAPCDSLDQLLSRFEFKNGVLDTTSEVVMLRVRVQRDKCCHSGGALEFGPDGLLYLSTGDNTSSKESDGYTPIDERPGRGPFDAQKSSGNTHDLRGAILRIKPEPDGSYSIPEGNLFPADGSDGRPEIFAKGCRNPFRIAIDRQTNYLYWGDVGPDVGEDGRYGPQSYDEWNQAREPGYFGWPYFVGDNFAYPARDFSTDEVGPLFDPAKPINESPNNFGRRELPPAQGAFIWYPYGPSAEFPQLGQGSRSAMAGPFYYRDGQVPLTNRSFPDYYVGKWFIYEWARSWVKVVTLDSAHQEIVQIEDFLPDFKISKPIDMKFGPDGAMYLLEYGNDYFLNNPDARLVRISYSAGNRPPRARLTADALAGGIPFSPVFNAANSTDPDPLDSLSYRWYLNGRLVTGETANFQPTLRQAGKHTISVVVMDQAGAKNEASLTVVVGNAPPVLALNSAANQSFLLPNQSILNYATDLFDVEDAAGAGVDTRQAMISASLVEDADLATSIRLGKASLPSGPLEFVGGAKLIEASDCYTCHKERSENVGPAYLDVAERYADTQDNITMLAGKIIRGGNGNWGERLMSGHPALPEEDAALMAAYILSLNDQSRLPLQGSIDLPDSAPTGSAFVLSAAYRDRGSATAPPLTSQHTIVLRPPYLEAEQAADELYRAHVPQGGEHHAFKVVTFRPGGFLKMENIDLKDVRKLRLGIHAYAPGIIEIRYGSPAGPMMSQSHFPRQDDWNKVDALELSLPPAVTDTLRQTDLYVVWLGEDGKAEDDMGHHRPADAGWLDWIEVR